MSARRILIVDGDAHVRALIGGVLRSRGIDFDEARDGADGLHCITVSDYALIILDLSVSGIGGVDLLQSLRVLRAGLLGKPQSCPNVIVTTSCTEDDLPTEDILRRGSGHVRAVLRKPINLSELSNLTRV